MKDELKNKLYNYQVDPPASTWPSIARELDNEVKATFPQKLYSFETAPPPGVWNKIAGELESSHEKVIPLFKKNPKIWRYAAAAAVIGFLAISFFWFNDQQLVPNEGIATFPEESASQKSNDLPTPENNLPAIVEPDALAAEDKKDKNKWVAKNSYREQYPEQRIYAYASRDEIRNSPAQLAHSFSVDDMANNLQPRDYTAQNIVYNPSQVAETNPYVTVITPDGYVVRISQKLAGMIGCLDNEPALNDVDCKARVQKWREQIAQSPITPTPGNFLDMLDLINSIK